MAGYCNVNFPNSLCKSLIWLLSSLVFFSAFIHAQVLRAPVTSEIFVIFFQFLYLA